MKLQWVQDVAMRKKEGEAPLSSNFSLTQSYSDRIDEIAVLVPRAKRSDVVKAAIDAFGALPEDKRREFLSAVVSK